MTKLSKKSQKKKLVVRVTKQTNSRKSRRAVEKPKSALATLGQQAGTFLGGPIGGQIGMAAGKLITKITGFGDYKVNRNSISNGNSVPTFQGSSKGMKVCHREFLRDIVGSASFSNQSMPLNPGIGTTFPWLQRVASNFEEYSFEGLVFEYRPSSGSAISSTSSALGVVIMATDYDALNPPFVGKQQMESYEYSTSTVPFTGALHPVECLTKLNVLGSQFVRGDGPLPADADLRLYDVGNFNIATVGMQSSYVVGELWVTYDVLFRKPRIPPAIKLSEQFSRFREFPSGSATPVLPMGSGNGVTLENALGLTMHGTGSSIYIRLPETGSFLIVYSQLQTQTSNLVLGSNIVTLNYFADNSTSSAFASAPAFGSAIVALAVTVLASGITPANDVRLNPIGTATAGVTADVLVFPISAPPRLFFDGRGVSVGYKEGDPEAKDLLHQMRMLQAKCEEMVVRQQRMRVPMDVTEDGHRLGTDEQKPMEWCHTEEDERERDYAFCCGNTN